MIVLPNFRGFSPPVLRLPEVSTFASLAEPANGSVIGSVAPFAMPSPSSTSWSFSGDTSGLSINPSSGEITVSDGAALSYAAAKTRVFTVTARDSTSLSSCTVQLNLASGWYLQPLAQPTTRPVADGTRMCQGLSPAGMTSACYITAHELFRWDVEGGLTLAWQNRLNELTGSLAPFTLRAQIELSTNPGVWIDLTFGGQSSITAAVGATVWSDVRSGLIPAANGRPVWMRVATFVDGARWPLMDQRALRTHRGEGAVEGTSPISERPATGNFGRAYGPSAIVGQTRAPFAVALTGDSFLSGILFNADNNRASWAEHMLYGRIPFANLGTYGESQNNWNLNHSSRWAFTQLLGCNKVLLYFGSNDTAQNLTVAQTTQNDVVVSSIFYMAGMGVTNGTITSRTTSIDQWMTTAGQTVASQFAVGGVADQINTARLAGTQFVDRTIDNRPVFQDAANKIVVNGTTQNYGTPRSDGIHMTNIILLKCGAAQDVDAAFDHAPLVVAEPELFAYAAADWCADSLTGNLGDQVTSYVDRVGGATVSVAAGPLAPTIVAGPNGKKAIRATSANNQRLEGTVAALDNMHSGGGVMINVFKPITGGGLNNNGFGRSATKGANGSGAGRTIFMGCNGFAQTQVVNIGRATSNFSGQFAVGANSWNVAAVMVDKDNLAAGAKNWTKNYFNSNALSNPVGSGATGSDAGQPFVMFNNKAYTGAADEEHYRQIYVRAGVNLTIPRVNYAVAWLKRQLRLD